MQKALGLLILGGGLAFLVSENAPAPDQREEQLAAITRIVARATIIEPETVPAENPGLRRPVASPSATYAVPAPPLPTSTAVTTEPTTLPAVSIPNTIPPRAAAPSTGASPNIQRQLARQIQAELKRVGCYSGRLDGSWGERSRTAMATFIARVNASLPTTEPDVFLLSLIKGQVSAVCGPTCGTDEEPSGSRCVARSVVAKNDTATSRRADPAAASEPAPDQPEAVVAAARPDPLPGRMSIGGPVSGVAAPPAPVTEWTAPANERLPWQADKAQPQAAPAMAALEPEDMQSSATRNAAPLPRKAVKVKRAWSPAQRPVKRRYSYSRSVQSLFMHPLGRM